MVKKKASPQLSVADILNKSQDSIAGHSKYAKLLWQVERADSDACYKELFRCLSYMLTVPQKTNANVERALRFIATFTAEVPECSDDSCTVFIQDVVADLVLLSEAADKNVRMRACSLLAAIMQRVTVDMADDILDKLQEAMLGRLKDKVPQVRMYAALVLERLAEAGEDGLFSDDPVTHAYRKLLEVERNKDVRKCVLGAMVIVAGTTVVDLLERTNDISDTVRKQAFTVLATKCTMDALTADQRALVLWRGLRDRSPTVLAAAQKLLQYWLADACEGDVLKLLEALDVHAHPDEAEEAMKALTSAGNLALSSIAKDAQDSSTGLRRAPGSAFLSSQEAFFWRWVCEWLHTEGDAKGKAAAATRGAEADAEAAAASDSLQALEAALPASVAGLVELVAAHAAAGEEHSFATNQLLLIASHCVDMTDASGRKAAADLLHTLLRRRRVAQGDDAWDQSILEFARQVLSGPNEVASYLMEAITELRTGYSLGDKSGSTKEWGQVLSLASLLFQQLPSLRLAGTFGTGNGPADLFRSLIFPALGQPSLEVRAAGVRCLGLYCQLSTGMLQSAQQATADQILPLVSLRTFLAHDAHAVKCVAARALCDLALTRGPKILDACHTQLVDHPRDYLPATMDTAAVAEAAEKAAQDSQPLLEVLLAQLARLWAASGRTKSAKQEAAEALELGSIVAEGLAKLVMHQGQWKDDSPCRLEDAECVLVLSRLLAAYSDPATEPATATRQCLSIFFPAYAAFSGAHQSLLCQAVLPAARLLAQGATPAKSAAPNLLRFTLHLLQTPLASEEAQEGDHGYSRLAQEALSEVLACPKGSAAKPYVAALLKLLLGLPLKTAPQASVKALRVLADHVKAVVKDGTAGKDAATLAKRLIGLDVTPTEALSEEEVAEVVATAEQHGQSVELPFAAKAVNPTPGTMTSRPRASRRPAIVDRHDDTSSSDEGEEDEEAEGQESDDDNLSGDENAPLAAEQPAPKAAKVVRRGKGPRKAADVVALQENVQGLRI